MTRHRRGVRAADHDEVGELPRTFTAALGLAVGAVIGALVGIAVLVHAGDAAIGRYAAWGAGAGLLVGALSRTLGLGLFEGLLHALVGFAIGARDDGSLPPDAGPGTGLVLRLMLWLGFFGAVALVLWFW